MKIDDMQHRLTRMSTFYVYTINFIIDNYQKREKNGETVVTTYLDTVQYKKCIFYSILSVKCNFSSFQCSVDVLH